MAGRDGQHPIDAAPPKHAAAAVAADGRHALRALDDLLLRRGGRVGVVWAEWDVGLLCNGPMCVLAAKRR